MTGRAAEPTPRSLQTSKPSYVCTVLGHLLSGTRSKTNCLDTSPNPRPSVLRTCGASHWCSSCPIPNRKRSAMTNVTAPQCPSHQKLITSISQPAALMQRKAGREKRKISIYEIPVHSSSSSSTSSCF